jgi:hypothetical protein
MNEVSMNAKSALPGDDAAQRIVQHFQAEGFHGISEAMIIRISLKRGSRGEIDAAFEDAVEAEKMLPVHEHFELRPFGHFAASRSFDDARSAIQSDFGASLRIELPRLFFDPAPIVIDDAFATGTKYDAIVKLNENVGEHAFAVLLNDPDSSFIDYLGAHHGKDWEKIIGRLEATAVALIPEFSLD